MTTYTVPKSKREPDKSKRIAGDEFERRLSEVFK